jgi:hypothetical protein
MVKTSLGLPDDLWRATKIRAIEENRDAQDLVADALRDYLKRKSRKEGSR